MLSTTSASTAGTHDAPSRSKACWAKSWLMATLLCQATLCLSSGKLGGQPLLGGSVGQCGCRAPGESAHALLCRWGAGWLGAQSLIALGALPGPTAKSTVGVRRLAPAGAHHRNPRPVGSAAWRMQASVHIIQLSPSRRTRAGMVVMPNLANRAFPRDPAIVACGIAIQLGIL